MHTMNVLYMSTRHSLWPQYTAEEQNILKWAALFHDIKKRSVPEIQGRDHVHSFVSAGLTLEIFQRIGIIILDEENE